MTSERYHGGDWWQLTDAEESVFVIDRERFPRMITVWSCYEAFKNIALGYGARLLFPPPISARRLAVDLISFTLSRRDVKRISGAADSDDEALEIMVQPQRNKAAAVHSRTGYGRRTP